MRYNEENELNQGRIVLDMLVGKYLEHLLENILQFNSPHSSDYFKLINCLEEVTRANCSPRSADLIGDFVRNLFSGVVDVACGGISPIN